MTTTESIATSTTTVSTVTTMTNTENILSSSTTSETNTTTMIERKTNKNSYQTYGIFCGAALLFLGPTTHIYLFQEEKQEKDEKDDSSFDSRQHSIENIDYERS